MSLRASVVLCTRNRAAHLEDALQSLRAQCVDPSLAWEVIVVDNASSDASATVARESWPDPAPAPLTVVAEARQGVLHANHRGLSEARS